MTAGWGPSGPEIPLRDQIGFGSSVDNSTPIDLDSAEAIKRMPKQGTPPDQGIVNETLDRR